jgi:catechol 2,3-dioxygenase-like lactoylglutathione lyase family enzyme
MPSLGTRVVPSLLARDLPKTVEFYRTVLGFRLTGEQAGPDGPTWVELSRDGVALMFYADPPHGTPTEPIMSGTLYFHPDDVVALADEWRGKVAFEWGPEVMDYGMREFGIRDPNGYWLAFSEPA